MVTLNAWADVICDQSDIMAVFPNTDLFFTSSEVLMCAFRLIAWLCHWCHICILPPKHYCESIFHHFGIKKMGLMLPPRDINEKKGMGFTALTVLCRIAFNGFLSLWRVKMVHLVIVRLTEWSHYQCSNCEVMMHWWNWHWNCSLILVLVSWHVLVKPVGHVRVVTLSSWAMVFYCITI